MIVDEQVRPDAHDVGAVLQAASGVIDLRVELGDGRGPAPVQVLPGESAAVAPVDDSFRVQHRDDLEHVAGAEAAGAGVAAAQKGQGTLRDIVVVVVYAVFATAVAAATAATVVVVVVAAAVVAAVAVAAAAVVVFSVAFVVFVVAAAATTRELCSCCFCHYCFCCGCDVT